MKKDRIFRRVAIEEVPQVFDLILQRIKWMDENGIKQWNVTDYEKAYPISYYEDHAEKGTLFALFDKATGEMACAAVLREEDERWIDDAPSIYLHNYVSRIGRKGAGAFFLRCAEAYAIEKGKHFFRLDSAEENGRLAQYYESQGFSPVGRCQDGPYKGILRQKDLR